MKGYELEINVKRSICEYILEENNKKNFVSFSRLIEQLAKTWNFSISEDCNNRQLIIYGEEGFYVIASTCFILKELSDNHILCFNRIENGSTYNYNINTKANLCQPTPSIVTGDLYDFMLSHINSNLWVSQEFEWYKNHGFMSKELYEAKKQTNYARYTLFLSWITIIVSLFSLLFSNTNVLLYFKFF